MVNLKREERKNNYSNCLPIMKPADLRWTFLGSGSISFCSAATQNKRTV